ncbi:hypothetical protein V8E36_007684 [Tilletia maclaganii]
MSTTSSRPSSPTQLSRPADFAHTAGQSDWAMMTDGEESEMEVAASLGLAQKRKGHPESPSKNKSNAAKRTATGATSANGGAAGALSGAAALPTRQSSRIAENNIQPASGTQEVRTRVRRGTIDPEEAAAAAKRASRPATPVKEPTSIATGMPMEALANSTMQQLQRRQKKEDSVQADFKQAVTGLCELDRMNALEQQRLGGIRTLMTAAATHCLGTSEESAIPPFILEALEAWKNGKPVTSFMPSKENTAPATNTTPGKTSAAASPNWATVAASKSSQPLATKSHKEFPPLRPLEGFCLQGGTKRDVLRLEKEGPVEDQRLFIRIAEDNPIRHEDPYEVRHPVESALKVANAPDSLKIERVKPIATGFSLTPADAVKAAAFSPYLPTIITLLNATRIDKPDEYRRLCLRGLPAFVTSRGQRNKILGEHVQKALTARFPSLVFAETPRIISSGSDQPDSAPPLWLITLSSGSFHAEDGAYIPARLILMDRDFQLRVYHSNNASKHCERCLSWHHSTVKFRAQAPVCGHCGLTGHLTKNHTCSVCPPSCPARPLWRKEINAVVVPEGERLVRLRNRGRAARTAELKRLRVAADAAVSAAAAAKAAEATRRGEDVAMSEAGTGQATSASGAATATSAAPNTPSTTTTTTSIDASGPRSNALAVN